MENNFHAHIYFEAETRNQVAEFLASITRGLSERLEYIGKLIDRPIGPHPIPMFEIDFSKVHYAEVIEFLSANRGSLSILIHPQTGDDLKDHTVNAQWLGTPLALNLSEL